MVDDSVKLCEYKMGLVIQFFKGNDGVKRTAIVQMAHGQFNRPVVKLGPLFYGVYKIVFLPLLNKGRSHQTNRNEIGFLSKLNKK